MLNADLEGYLFSFPLAKPIKQKLKLWCSIVVIGGFFILISTIILSDYFPLMKLIYDKTIAYFVAIVLIFGLVLKFNNWYKLSGEIYFDNDKLIIKQDKGRIEFPYKEIAEVEFVVNGYNGQIRSIRAAIIEEGNGNIIKFKHKDDKFRFYFYLKNSFERGKIKEIKKVIENFSANNVLI